MAKEARSKRVKDWYDKLLEAQGEVDNAVGIAQTLSVNLNLDPTGLVQSLTKAQGAFEALGAAMAKEFASKLNAGVMSSAASEWGTPPEIFDPLNAEFRFTLDAAANAQNAKVPLYLGPDQMEPFNDALALDWSKMRIGGEMHRVWLNPPYGRGIGDWMQKAREEAWKGCTVVCLVPARTDTKWWWQHVKQAQEAGEAEIRFLQGRIKFLDNGKPRDAAPFPSAIVVYRPAKP